MKVLLLHEMSGVHTALRQGLRALGVDARIATFGDGFKRYPTDINLGTTASGLLAATDKTLRQLALAPTLRHFDVLQTISPNPFFRPISPLLERYLFRDGGRSVYVAAGSDAIYRRHVLELDYQPPHRWFDSPDEVARLARMLSTFSDVVPVCWEYRYAMERAGIPVRPVVPFPIDLAAHACRPLGRSGKIKVFHPLNRTDLAYDFKGTRIIQAAFERLEARYGDVAEFTCAGGIDHVAYDAFTDSVDVIVDQTSTYSYGMSAALGMAKGKAVLSGMEDRARVGFYRDCPVVNLLPDEDDVFRKIEALVTNLRLLRETGERSRAFAERYHDHRQVAQAYLDIYTGAADTASTGAPQ